MLQPLKLVQHVSPISSTFKMGKACQNVETGAVYQSPAWRKIKLAIRLLCMAGTIAVIALGLQIAVEYNTKYGYWPRLILYTGPVTLVVTFWDLVEMLVACIRKSGRGMHPGAHVALELIWWTNLLYVSYVTIQAALILQNDGYPDNDDYYRRVAVSAAVITTFCFFRFILFIRACVETHRRRMAGRTRPRVMVTPNADHSNLALTSYAYGGASGIGPREAEPYYDPPTKPGAAQV
ncbi:hypothetical protein MKZ38_008706 [Zalerion maritima]|uniref:Uncharacterized protein n=1 Tax=Zalerion maritima TaxID=339359 RepID=A0AAD5RGI2_9PEZI|nr:hypothetical protein MKZ38_008706 [Zalerion maritima]